VNGNQGIKKRGRGYFGVESSQKRMEFYSCQKLHVVNASNVQ
jgi:hypothetical protein